MDKQYCTIGILGLYVVIEAFGYTKVDEFGYTYYTDEGIELAGKIFNVLNDVKDNFTQDFSFNIESVPAERAAVILCQKDNLLYNLDKYFRGYADRYEGVDADDVLCWMYQKDLPEPPIEEELMEVLRYQLR